MKKILNRRWLWSIAGVAIPLLVGFFYLKYQQGVRNEFLRQNANVSLHRRVFAPELLRQTVPDRTLRHLGFEKITRLSVTSDAQLSELNRLFDLTHVDSAQLRGPDITDASLSVLEQMPRLFELFLDGSKMTDAAVPTLARFNQLQALSIVDTPITADGLLQFNQGHTPSQIAIDRSFPRDDRLKLLLSLPELSQIRPVSHQPLSGVVTDADLLLAEEPVEWSGSSYIEFQVTDDGMQRLSCLPNLRTLTVIAQGEGAVTDKGLSQISHLSQLQSLSLTDVKLTDQGMRALSELPELLSLDLIDPVEPEKITAQGWSQIAMNHTITHLKLSGVNIDGATIETLAGLPELKSLKMIRCQLKADALESLARFPALDTVSLEEMVITDAQLRLLVKLPGLSALSLRESEYDMSLLAGLENHVSLTHLYLRGCAVPTEIIRKLATIETFTHLGVHDCQLTSDGFAALGQLPYCEMLVLTGSNVTDQDLEALSDSDTLIHLMLSETGITDDGLAHLAKIKNLSRLNLADTAITDEGVAHLALQESVRSRRFIPSSWEWLILSGTKITDKSLSLIGTMMGVSAIVDLSETEITDEGIRQLQTGRRISILQLQNTNISDAAVPELNRLNVGQLNIKGSRITERGTRNLSDQIQVAY